VDLGEHAAELGEVVWAIEREVLEEQVGPFTGDPLSEGLGSARSGGPKGARRPVMVWIQGGAYKFGSADGYVESEWNM
jgi:hypothetical protein